MKELTAKERIEILALRISEFIYELPSTQLTTEPFSNLSLDENDVHRAKFCLYIFNLCYAYYIINLFYKNHIAAAKNLLDCTQKKFREKLDSDDSNKWLTFDSIVFLEVEKNYMVSRIKKLGLQFDAKTKTSLRDIFDFIWDIRYPEYYDGIIKAKRRKDESNPFYQLALNFTRHFLGKEDSNFAYEFSIYVNIRTMNSLFEFIQDNIKELYE